MPVSRALFLRVGQTEYGRDLVLMSSKTLNIVEFPCNHCNVYVITKNEVQSVMNWAFKYPWAQFKFIFSAIFTRKLQFGFEVNANNKPQNQFILQGQGLEKSGFWKITIISVLIFRWEEIQSKLIQKWEKQKSQKIIRIAGGRCFL